MKNKELIHKAALSHLVRDVHALNGSVVSRLNELRVRDQVAPVLHQEAAQTRPAFAGVSLRRQQLLHVAHCDVKRHDTHRLTLLVDVVTTKHCTICILQTHKHEQALT